MGGLTAGAITWPDGTAVVGGDLVAGAVVEVAVAAVASGTPTFHLLTRSQTFPVGTVLDLVGAITVAPPGWVLAMQGTIGSATSSATIRAAADCANLYAHLWTLADADAPVTGGRGASAAADFAANKPIGGLDLRGVARATFDSFGGTAAGRLPGFRAGQIGGLNQISGLVSGYVDVSGSVSGSVSGHVIGTASAGSGSGAGSNFASDQTLTSTGSMTGSMTGSIRNDGNNLATVSIVQPTRTVSSVIKL